MFNEFHEDIKSYKDALEEVFKIRKDRKKIYGESWQKNTSNHLFILMSEKFSRLNFLRENQSQQDDYESQKDACIDLINYSLFYLQKLLDEEK